jgi:hypothetical protein
MPTSSKWSLTFRFSNQNFVYIFHYHIYYIVSSDSDHKWRAMKLSSHISMHYSSMWTHTEENHEKPLRLDNLRPRFKAGTSKIRCRSTSHYTKTSATLSKFKNVTTWMAPYFLATLTWQFHMEHWWETVTINTLMDWNSNI